MKKYPIIILLAGLPEGIAEEAQKEAEKNQYEDVDVVSEQKPHLDDAVIYGFTWHNSKRGDDYWYKIWLQLYKLGI